MNSKTKIIALILVGIGLLGIALVFVFSPLSESVKKMNKDLSEKQTSLDEIKTQILEFKTAQSDLAKATYKKDVSDAIVIRENLAEVIVDLEEAAQLTNTTESIQIMEDDGTNKNQQQPDIFESLVLSQEVDYSMSVKNSYEGLVEYFQYLEHLPHFTEFNRFTITSVYEQIPVTQGGGTRNTGTVSGNVEGVFLVKNKDVQTQKSDN